VTGPEITQLIGYVNQRWPHAALDADAFPVWLEDLADMPTEECGAAVRRWARAGERFPPTSGFIRSEVIRRAQAPAPSLDDAQRLLARLAGRCIPYGASSPEDTVEAIEKLAAAGVHECVLRWVQAVGVYAVRMMPDPELQPLDMNQMADRRDRVRDYDRRIVPEWRADPRPGVALERARQAAELGDGSRGTLKLLDAAKGIEGGS
jgi:hypothetical protein